MNESYLSPERNNNKGKLENTYNEFHPLSPLEKQIEYHLQQQQQMSPNRFNLSNDIYLNEEMHRMNEELKELELQEKELLRKKHIIDGINF